ncbi:hypothetical protein EVA_02035 [gut metagenome]|uniref:Uncharacterized protein n=1 Tax=gut metagenome TaxID=749906 RepID=J9DAE6_9ZZZZ
MRTCSVSFRNRSLVVIICTSCCRWMVCFGIRVAPTYCLVISSI